MKKSFIFFLFAGVFTLSAFSQTWVTLTQREPAAPEITLIRSNNQEVNFTVGVPGFFSTPITENGTNYQRISIQGYGTTGATGEPEIPVISHRIAVPECKGGITYSVRITDSQTLPGYMLYPAPDYQLNSEGMLEEVFAVNPLAYLPNAFTPGSDYAEAETGAFRNQKFVTLHIYPFQFNPATVALQVATEMEVTLTFNQPVTDVNAQLGPFSKSAAATFLNYEGSGNGFMQYDKAFEKPGFVPGKVKWITITNPAQADTLSCDYLIITVPEFFSPKNADLQRLAKHRAWYNGYDVAIVNVADIFDDNVGFDFEEYYQHPPPYQYKDEQRLRTFIRQVYEGQNAPHIGDGHLAFVLLVGDWEDGVGIPCAKEREVKNYPYTTDFIPSDYYYSCITKDAGTGGYDDFGDICIGRFSVEHENHLQNMVKKTINHEREFSPKLWRETAGFTNIWNYGSINLYFDYVSNLMNNSGWNYSIVDGYQLNGAIKIPTLEYFNSGVALAQYISIPPDPATAWHTDGLDISYFSNVLSNAYQTPFINTVGSQTVHFDDTESLGEFLTRYDSIKGAVGYIGAIRYTPGMGITTPEPDFLGPIFNNQSIAGDLLLTAKGNFNDYYTLQKKYTYHLLGDPALNILADGFEITRNVTADCPAKIPCRVRIHNGATLTVPANCNLKFLEAGKLTVDENGSMVIGDGALVYGVNSQIDTVIHIKGGDFIVGEDVVFNDLPGGILLENNGSILYDDNKHYVLDGVTFNNTPLIHKGTKFNGYDCTFNTGSNVTTNFGTFKTEHCTFNEATFLADNTVTFSLLKPNLKGTGIAFGHAQFSGNGSNTAVQLINIQAFEIGNSTISGYETGVSLTNSNNVNPITSGPGMHSNEVSNCNTGIELYNSTSIFSSNYMHDNIHGIKLFNNSYTIFDNEGQPAQAIQDCDSIEIYACATSFPTIFRYNKIVDVNLGISNMPLVYWDVEQPYPKERDIRYNCWGKGFDPSNYLHPSKLLVWDPVWDCKGKSGAPPRGDDEELYLAGLDYFANEDYPNAESTFKELINTYPQSHFAIAALHELFALEHYTNQDFYSLNSFYATIAPLDSNLFNIAEFLATRCLVKERDWQPAVDWYEERIMNPPSYQDSVFAVIDLGDIHLMMEADTIGKGKSGHFCHYRLPDIKPKSRMRYEETKTSLLATLPQIKKPKKDVSSEISDVRYETCDRKGSLGECVPNPTHGDATISYEIFTGGVVEIQLFNSIGQMVKSLPQGNLSKGNYKTTVSVSGMPVGVYYYTLVVNGERVDGKKVVVN